MLSDRWGLVCVCVFGGGGGGLVRGVVLSLDYTSSKRCRQCISNSRVPCMEVSMEPIPHRRRAVNL